MQEILSILKSIPPEAWIALATAILTSGITLAGVWFTNHAANQRLKIQLHNEREVKYSEQNRERLEELYIISNKYLSTLVCHYLPYQRVMRGEISYNQALDMTIDSASKKEYDPHRVTMLIHMYFPEVKPAFDEIMNIREKLNDIIDGYKEQYKRGDTHGAKWLELFQPLLEKLATLAEHFDENVVNLKR